MIERLLHLPISAVERDKPFLHVLFLRSLPHKLFQIVDRSAQVLGIEFGLFDDLGTEICKLQTYFFVARTNREVVLVFRGRRLQVAFFLRRFAGGNQGIGVAVDLELVHAVGCRGQQQQAHCESN